MEEQPQQQDSGDHEAQDETQDESQPKYDKWLAMEGTDPAHRGQSGVDPETGWRWENRAIGMTRNAQTKNRKWLKVFLDPDPHVVKDQNVPLRGWYKARNELPGVRPRPCFTEALLTQPYGGSCPVRCQFCYINNGIRGYRGQGITVLDPSYPDKISKQMRSIRTATAFYISSFTEPFQPRLEAHYHNTERTAQVATHYGLPIFFLSRQVPPDWAIDQLRHNQYSYQQFSINTPCENDWRKLSLFAATLPELLDAVEMMNKAGVYVSIQCNPITPGVTSNEQIVELIHTLAARGADHVIFKFVEIVSPTAKSMMKRIDRLFPDRAPIFRELFTETIGHMRTVKEEYRLNALKLFKKETQKAGITMGLCYEYTYERDAAGKILNKTGISLGHPSFGLVTADQCHGRRVPMFSRASAGDVFEEITDCPPSGCLYCGKEKEHGLPPSGSNFLGEAKALRPVDLKETGWTRKHGNG